MPKNNCLFPERWLEDEWFKHWIRKKMTLNCNMQLLFADIEEAALTLHMKCQKHVERSPSDQFNKSLMPAASAPPLIILKNSLLKS